MLLLEVEKEGVEAVAKAMLTSVDTVLGVNDSEQSYEGHSSELS